VALDELLQARGQLPHLHSEPTKFLP